MAEPTMPEKLGRYEVIRELGKGAMGVVYEGKDPNIGRRVAIKTARREVVEASGMADEMMERFLREARAAGALNHPNIITIYDAAEEEGIAYIAMEYLEGGDLNDIIEAKKKLDMAEIVDIGACICEALDLAHANGVVHRDIKPANILMPTGQPLKVADFGIAHVSDSNLTQDGAMIGTPHYMSPEQFMGQKLDGRSDLFSVGNILYELTTGEKPFGGEQLSTVMHHVIKTDPVSPAELNFNVPETLARVILKALSKRPAQRYKTGAVMAAALRESLKENPDPAIIDPAAATAMEATVAGGAAPAPDATVAGGPPPGNEDLVATVPGARPGNQETTVTGPPAGGAPDATAPGGPPPPPETTSTMPGGAPSAAGAAGSKGPGRALLLGGALVAVLIVVLGGIMMARGGGEEPGGAAREESAAVDESAATPAENYYAKLQFEIYQAKEEEDYRRWARGNATLDELSGGVELIEREMRIQVLDTNDEVLVDSANWPEPWKPGDLVEIDPAPSTPDLAYRVFIPAADDPSEFIQPKGTIPAAGYPGAIGTVQVVIGPPPGI